MRPLRPLRPLQPRVQPQQSPETLKADQKGGTRSGLEEGCIDILAQVLQNSCDLVVLLGRDITIPSDLMAKVKTITQFRDPVRITEFGSEHLLELKEVLERLHDAEVTAAYSLILDLAQMISLVRSHRQAHGQEATEVIALGTSLPVGQEDVDRLRLEATAASGEDLQSCKNCHFKNQMIERAARRCGRLKSLYESTKRECEMSHEMANKIIQHHHWENIFLNQELQDALSQLEAARRMHESRRA